jgi:hypothetical protein
MINEYGVVGGMEMAGEAEVLRENLPTFHLTLLKGKMFTTPDPKQKTNKMI